MSWLAEPWPWYVGGPLIGLTVPIVYLLSRRRWGVSSTFQDLCAAVVPGRLSALDYDWKRVGGWRLSMAAGLVVGGAIAGLAGRPDVAISAATRAELIALGLTDFTGIAPSELFAWTTLATPAGLVLVVVGGFLVGFGTRYAGGCTSGHSISGLSALRASSLAATIAFFAGGLIAANLLLPLVLGAGS